MSASVDPQERLELVPSSVDRQGRSGRKTPSADGADPSSIAALKDPVVGNSPLVLPDDRPVVITSEGSTPRESAVTHQDHTSIPSATTRSTHPADALPEHHISASNSPTSSFKSDQDVALDPLNLPDSAYPEHTAPKIQHRISTAQSPWPSSHDLIGSTWSHITTSASAEQPNLKAAVSNASAAAAAKEPAPLLPFPSPPHSSPLSTTSSSIPVGSEALYASHPPTPTTCTIARLFELERNRLVAEVQLLRPVSGTRWPRGMRAEAVGVVREIMETRGRVRALVGRLEGLGDVYVRHLLDMVGDGAG